MAKKEELTKPAAEQPATEQPAVEERPNRKRYSEMWAEDNPDVDFEDKEARYGRMAEDREKYRALKKSGTQLTQALDRNRWLAAMFQDLAENPEKNPLVWMAEHGIDVKAALDDPEVMAKVDEKFQNWQQNQLDGEAAENAKGENIAKSHADLLALKDELGLTDEQVDHMWEHFWDDVFAPAFSGIVSKDTWKGLLHSINYDKDIASAKEQAGMMARNDKIQNKLKKRDQFGDIPPSLPQGGRAGSAREDKTPGFFDDIIKPNRNL